MVTAAAHQRNCRARQHTHRSLKVANGASVSRPDIGDRSHAGHVCGIQGDSSSKRSVQIFDVRHASRSSSSSDSRIQSICADATINVIKGIQRVTAGGNKASVVGVVTRTTGKRRTGVYTSRERNRLVSSRNRRISGNSTGDSTCDASNRRSCRSSRRLQWRASYGWMPQRPCQKIQ